MRRHRVRLMRVCLVCFVLTPLSYWMVARSQPQVRVTVVLVDDCPTEYGAIVQDAFIQSGYADVFDAELSCVRVATLGGNGSTGTTGTIATDDLFALVSDPLASGSVELAHGGLVLLVTTRSIVADRFGHEHLVGGEASTRFGAAVVTVAQHRADTPFNRRWLQHTALHEVFHLLGYPHNYWARSGVMQFDPQWTVAELAPYYDAQLPIRAWVLPLCIGLPLPAAVALSGATVAVVLLPAVFAADRLIGRAHRRLSSRLLPHHRYQPQRSSAWIHFLLSGLLLTVLNGSAVVIGVVLAVLTFVFQLEATIGCVKQVRWERRSGRSS